MNSGRRELGPRRDGPFFQQRRLVLLTLLLGLSGPRHGNAQPGTIDTTLQFGPASASFTKFTAAAALPDGKILVSGDFTSIQGYFRSGFARLNSDGSLDLGFDAPLGGRSSILTQPDGHFFLPSGNAVPVGRYTQDGERDTNYNIAPLVYGTTSQILLQSDGRFLVVGEELRRNMSDPSTAVMRVGVDGTWDTNFNVTVGSALSAFVQTNGQILVGCDWSPWPGGARRGALRLNSDGSLDTSFDPGTGPNGLVTFVWGQPDGKVIINGDFTTVRDYPRIKFARFNPDGTLDPVFPQSNWRVGECVPQPDGRLWIRTLDSGDRPAQVFRLNSDWTDDATVPRYTFLNSNGSRSQPASLSLQADGRLLVAGAFTRYTSGDGAPTANRIVRINCDNPVPLRFSPQPPAALAAIEGRSVSCVAWADGFPPPRFQWRFEGTDIVGATNHTLLIEEVLPSHGGSYQFVASNAFETIVSAPCVLTVILLPRIVAQPQPQSVPAGGTFSAAVQATGTEPLQYQWKRDGVTLTGQTNATLTITNVQSSDAKAYSVTVSNLGGSVTSTNAPLNVLLPPSISVQPRSKTVFAGSEVELTVTASGDGPVSYQWWFNDTALAGATNSTLHFASAVLTMSGPYRVQVTNPHGSATSATAKLTVFDETAKHPGLLDVEFEPGVGFVGSAVSVAMTRDGLVYAAGSWPSGTLVRLRTDGTLDTAFAAAVPAWTCKAVTVQADGRVLIGLGTYSHEGASRYSIGRLRGDGLQDKTFIPEFGLQPQLSVTAMAVQTNGRIVVGGTFTNVNKVTQRGIARLNPDAASDTNFFVGDGVDYRVLAVAVQSDGKTLVGGDFSTIAGALRNGIARLEPNGSPDWGFDPGWGVEDAVRAIAVQPDGKVLIAGSFTVFDLQARNRIARLDADGSLDHTFDPQDGPDGDVYSMAYQADGKIVIGGAFTSYNGEPRGHVARLMPDGGLDANFDTSNGPNGDVLSLAIQPDGRVVIGGAFNTVDGIARPGIARLNGNIDTPVSPVITSQPQQAEVTSGFGVTFAIASTGTLPLAYQWFKDGTKIAGATNAQLAIAQVQPADAGAYLATVTNLAGSTTSEAAALVVDGRPVVVRQPADQSAVSGRSAQFSVSAVGPGTLTFAWLHDGLELADGETISGANKATLTLHDVSVTNAGNYSMRVSSEYGTVISKTAKLRVLPGNDDLANAIPLAALGGRTIGDNRDASKEPGEPDHAGDAGGNSVWYQWVPELSGMVVLDTWGSLFDTLLAVYRGTTVTGLTLMAANDDGMGFLGQSSVSFPAEAGVAYSVAVDGYRGDAGQIVLNWCFEAPVFGSTSVRDQAVLLQLGAPVRSVVVIEASVDLEHWIPVSTNMVLKAGLSGWEVPVTPGLQHQFFRGLRH